MRCLAALSLACACAHAAAPPAVQVEAAPAGSKKPLPKATPPPALNLSDDTTAPVRQSCRLKGPRLSSRDRLGGSVIVNYRVSAEGSVSEVAVQGDATAGAIRAVKRYLESCRYKPATQNGKPVAAQWKGELSFGDTLRNPATKAR